MKREISLFRLYITFLWMSLFNLSLRFRIFWNSLISLRWEISTLWNSINTDITPFNNFGLNWIFFHNFIFSLLCFLWKLNISLSIIRIFIRFRLSLDTKFYKIFNLSFSLNIHHKRFSCWFFRWSLNSLSLWVFIFINFNNLIISLNCTIR